MEAPRKSSRYRHLRLPPFQHGHTVGRGGDCATGGRFSLHIIEAGLTMWKMEESTPVEALHGARRCRSRNSTLSSPFHKIAAP